MERIISLLRRKYTLLSSTVPIRLIKKCSDDSGMTTLDKIAVIGSALCNCCDSIVPSH